MRTQRHIVALIMMLGGAWAWVAASPDTPPLVLATAGPVEVTADDFRAEYGDYLLTTGVPDKPMLRRAFVEQMAAQALLVHEAREAGIGRQAAYLAHEAQARTKLLLDLYLQRVLFDTLRVTEAELEALFLRVNTDITARHLYAPTREAAEALYARLQAGETFEALAREVFNDSALAASGGSVGTFGYDEMDPAFEDAAYTLAVGDISEPVQTAQGFSVIQVRDRFTKPLLTETEFAAKRPQLQHYARYRKQQAVRKTHVRELAEALNLTFDARGLSGLLAQVSGMAFVESEEAFEAWLAGSLVTFGLPGQRRTWTVGAFRQIAAATSVAQRGQVRTEADLTTFIEGLAVRDEILRRAEAMRLAETPALAEALLGAMDEFVLAQERDRIAVAVEIPEETLRAAFDEQKDHFDEPLTFEQARPLIEQQLRVQYRQNALQQTYAALRARYPLTIDTEKLLALRLTNDGTS